MYKTLQKLFASIVLLAALACPALGQNQYIYTLDLVSGSNYQSVITAWHLNKSTGVLQTTGNTYTVPANMGTNPLDAGLNGLASDFTSTNNCLFASVIYKHGTTQTAYDDSNIVSYVANSDGSLTLVGRLHWPLPPPVICLGGHSWPRPIAAEFMRMWEHLTAPLTILNSTP